jgi:hypothetical protein
MVCSMEGAESRGGREEAECWVARVAEVGVGGGGCGIEDMGLMYDG